ECVAAPPKGKALADAVAATCRRLSIADASGAEIAPALYLLREDREAFYLFLCNVGHDYAGKADSIGSAPKVRDRTAVFPDVRIKGFGACAGDPLELDPDTGKVFTAEAARKGDAWEIRTSFLAVGSRMFVIPKTKALAKGSYPRRKTLRAVRTEALDGRWEIGLSESNVLVLDRPRYRIGTGEWQEAAEILRVNQAVCDVLKTTHRGVQPWARKIPKTLRRARVSLAYDIEVKTAPSGDLFLALEQPATFRVALNGVPLHTDMECGWWTDRSLRKVALDPALLRLGTNRLTLDCDYAETHPGLEIVYVMGHFGVEVQGAAVAMTAAPASLALGDWVPQGLAFYAGSVSYARTIRPALSAGERLVVRVPEYRGVAVRVLVNGAPAGVIAWEPNEVDITDQLVAGQETELRIEVIGHRRNSHGPLHFAEKSPAWTGPGQFISTGEKWTDNYQLVACGLMVPPELVVLRDIEGQG
ncbi:MAG: hypothetical protein PHR35_17285, partial [Kiritimatiellae bacterium]|nr:hypothetical protein [Kiritimatiellia bacterium]